MTTQPARDDLTTAQRARTMRTVRVLALIAFGFYLAVILNGALHR
jgi:hypothetical protein